MKYINAKTILPKALIEELQNYVQAGYIYVPAKEERHRSWGEVSGYREELERRNKKIRMEYGQGISVEELACRYCPAVFLYKTLRYHSVDCGQTKPPGKIFLSSQTYRDGAVVLVIFQEYLYILCEFVEHSFKTIGSKRHRLSNKMYKYSRF